MSKGYVKNLVQTFGEFVVDMNTHRGIREELTEVQTTETGPEWDDKMCHSPPESPVLRRHYGRDSGLPTSMLYSVGEGGDNFQSDGYGYSSEITDSNNDKGNHPDSKHLKRSSVQSTSEYGSECENSDRHSLNSADNENHHYFILEKEELPMRGEKKNTFESNMQNDRTSSGSRHGIIFDEHVMRKDRVRTSAGSRHGIIIDKGDIQRDRTSAGPRHGVTSQRTVDENNSDEFEDCDDNLWGSDFSSDEYCECNSDVDDYYDEIEHEGPKQQKLYRIVDELVNTEKTYVRNLHLLDQIIVDMERMSDRSAKSGEDVLEVFQKRIKSENETQPFLPPEVIPQMFSNVGSIYQFHSGFLLPKLEERMANWISTSKVGDIMKDSAPFFKLYTEFMNNFDNAMLVIKTWEEKCPRFAEILNEIQSTPDCNRLSLTHHMLGPVQRLPRYEMLLKDYIKHLPEDSEDLSDANEALNLVTEATLHANEVMKNEQFHKLMEINEKLGGVINLITPTRHFIKEGFVTKITARRGYKQERYLFLFNDLLLVCSQHLLGTFSLKNRLEVDGMEVVEKEDSGYIQLMNDEGTLHIPDTFYVRSRQKIVQFCYGSEDGENINWCELIKDVIVQLQEKRRSFLREDKNENEGENLSGSTSSEFELGEHAPIWVKDYEVTMCMRCGSQFSTLKRRHHCRACGFVVCWYCSTRKIALSYDDNKINRVCDTCYDLLNSKKREIFSDYLNVSKDRGKTWKKRWFSAKTDFYLYYHRTRKDIYPAGSYNLKLSTIEELESVQHIFKLSDGSKLMYLYSDTKDGNEKWLEILKKMNLSELPD